MRIATSPRVQQRPQPLPSLTQRPTGLTERFTGTVALDPAWVKMKALAKAAKAPTPLSSVMEKLGGDSNSRVEAYKLLESRIQELGPDEIKRLGATGDHRAAALLARRLDGEKNVGLRKQLFGESLRALGAAQWDWGTSAQAAYELLLKNSAGKARNAVERTGARASLYRLRGGSWEDRDKLRLEAMRVFREEPDMVELKDLKALGWSRSHAFHNRYPKETRATNEALKQANHKNPLTRLKVALRPGAPRNAHSDSSWREMVEAAGGTNDDRLKTALLKRLKEQDRTHVLPSQPLDVDLLAFDRGFSKFGKLFNARLASRIKDAKGGTLRNIRELAELKGYTRDSKSNVWSYDKERQVDEKLQKAMTDPEFLKVLEKERASAAREVYGDKLPKVVAAKRKWLESKDFQTRFDSLPSKDAAKFLQKELGELAALDPEAASRVSNAMAARLLERHRKELANGVSVETQKQLKLGPAATLARLVGGAAKKGRGAASSVLKTLGPVGRTLGMFSDISGLAHDLAAGDAVGVAGKSLQMAGGFGLMVSSVTKAIPGLNVLSWLATGTGFVLDLFSEDRDEELARRHGVR